MSTTISIQIEKQISSLQKKLDRLNGSYLTNTPKRQREQRHRDTLKEQYRLQIQLLQYLEEEALCQPLTIFEQALIVDAFYNEMRAIAHSIAYAKEFGLSTAVTLPVNDATRIKRFHKAGITCSNELESALTIYQELMKKATMPENPKISRMRDLIYKAKLRQGGDIQFTPSDLVNRMIALADLKPESRVLEPESGIASIADEAKKITSYVDCVERDCDFYELLQLKGHNVVGRDFLECECKPIYDVVLMNPPFSAQYEHIQHAFGFLKPGGKLISVCSVNVLHPPKQQKHQDFQRWLDDHEFDIQKTDAQFEMTSVNSVLLIMKKSRESKVA